MRAILFLLLTNLALGQSQPKTDCSTLFICIDSLSYRTIFANSFIKDTLFVCKQSETKTANDAYTGKYAIGKAATIEFFKPRQSETFGDKYGDWGIEFKTRKIGQLSALLKLTEKESIKIDTSSTVLHQDDLKILWYKSISIKNKNSELSILEYQKEYLDYLGFDDSKINTEMSIETFNTTLANGMKYPRQFYNIKSITIEIDQKQLNALSDFCFLNAMKQEGQSFSSGEFSIKYDLVTSISKMSIKEIELNLIEDQPLRSIALSEKIRFTCVGKNAKFIFNN